MEEELPQQQQHHPSHNQQVVYLQHQDNLTNLQQHLHQLTYRSLWTLTPVIPLTRRFRQIIQPTLTCPRLLESQRCLQQQVQQGKIGKAVPCPTILNYLSKRLQNFPYIELDGPTTSIPTSTPRRLHHSLQEVRNLPFLVRPGFKQPATLQVAASFKAFWEIGEYSPFKDLHNKKDILLLCVTYKRFECNDRWCSSCFVSSVLLSVYSFCPDIILDFIWDTPTFWNHLLNFLLQDIEIQWVKVKGVKCRDITYFYKTQHEQFDKVPICKQCKNYAIFTIIPHPLGKRKTHSINDIYTEIIKPRLMQNEYKYVWQVLKNLQKGRITSPKFGYTIYWHFNHTKSEYIQPVCFNKLIQLRACMTTYSQPTVNDFIAYWQIYDHSASLSAYGTYHGGSHTDEESEEEYSGAGEQEYIACGQPTTDT